MPFYTVRCGSCQKEKDILCRIGETPEATCECSGKMTKVFNKDSVLGHVRGSTIGKALKESKLRRKRNAELGVRQIERYGGQSRLVPNVEGVEVDSWKDAAKLASDSGKDASGYKAQAETEKHTQNSAGVDERKWKKAKEIARNVM